MIRKRCGVNLGKEILDEAKEVFEVHNFWRKLPHLNNVIKKVAKGGFQRNRIIVIESEAVNGLTSWLRNSKIKALFNPSIEEMRNEIASPNACFFLFTPDEYAKRKEADDFQKIIKKLPNPLDLSIISQSSQLNLEEVLSAFSEVNELPYCAKHIIEMKESSMVNLVAFLILFKNYQEFCCEAMYCTEEMIGKCKECLSKFSLRFKREFFDLLRLNGIYYPLSLYMRQSFPENCVYVDLSLYVNKFASPLELAIFLHDAYQMGAAIYPGFGITTDIEDKPDGYLLDYIYPLEKSIPLEYVSALIFLSALEKNGDRIKDFLEDVTDKIKRLPLGGDVGEFLSKSVEVMNNCYDLWHFSEEDVSSLYAIWKLKRMLESSYQRTKADLSKLNSSKAKTFVDRINSLLYGYKDFLEHDLAIELGINTNLAKEFFKNINDVSKGKNEVDAFEQLLLLYHGSVCDKLKAATVTYVTKKIAASQIWENVLSTLKQLESLDSNEILEVLPYVITLFDYPIYSIEEKITFLQVLRNKQCDQTREVIDFIKKAVMDEIVIRPSLSIEIDKLVNQWETGNPLNFFKRRIEEEIGQNRFDSNLFRKAFETFSTINTLKLFRREPSRFFDYQHTLDRYISLKMKKSGKEYFDYFQPITSVFDTVRKLQEENKKVILLIFDGLGFIHSYFACLEVSRKESKQLTEFLQYIISLFKKGNGQILSSLVPTVTGVNHIALLFGERILYEDSFLIRMTDDSFASDKADEKAKTFSVLGLRDEDRKSAIYRLRLEESHLQRPTGLWDMPSGQVQKKGLLISANSERSFLSYLFKGNATFKQVDSYTNAIEEAFSDKSHDLVVSQVNLMDAFLQSINVRPPALIDDIVTGYWEAYLDLWKNVITRIFKGFTGLKKGTVLIITADHGLAWGKTGEFKETIQILSSIKDVKYLPKYNVGELVTSDGKLVGASIPGHRPMKFMSIFLLKNGIDEKRKIKEALEFAQQNGDIVFEEINIEESKRNLTIKPDFLIFPTIGMFSRPDKRKYYGGIHGGISMCELFIPLLRLEK